MLDQVPQALAVASQLAWLVALIRSLAGAEVTGLTAALDPADLDRSWNLLAPPTVARLLSLFRRGNQQGQLLGTMAAQLWTPVRTALSTVPQPGATVPTATDVMRVLVTSVLGETKTRIGQGATIGEAKEHARLRGVRAAAGMGSDATHGGYRQAIYDGGMVWARVPTGQACPFCLLMASRGPVYHTAQTAQGGKGHYHPWDRCRAIAVPKHTDVSDYMPDSVAPLVSAADAAYHDEGSMNSYLKGDFAKGQNTARSDSRTQNPAAL